MNRMLLFCPSKEEQRCREREKKHWRVRGKDREMTDERLGESWEVFWELSVKTNLA